MDKKKIIIVSVGVVLLGVLGYFGYKYYKEYKNQPSTNPEENPPTGTNESPEVEAMISKIKADANWYAMVVQKAKDNNISTQQQLINDAKWVITHPNG